MKKYFVVLFLVMLLIVSVHKVQASYSVPPANLLAGAIGTDGPAIPVCTIESMTIAPSMVAYGSNAVLSWKVGGVCSSITLNGKSVGEIISDNKSVGPLTQTTSYLLSAVGKNGTVTKSVSVTVLPKTPPQDPACAITAPPSITVVSPNGGETYEAGKQITVTWKNCNITSKTASIYLYDGIRYQPTYPLATQIANDGSEVVTLPTLALYPAMKYGNNFQIIVSNSDFSVNDYSDATFTLTEPSAKTQSITVTSPKAGDAYKPGQLITLNWTSKNIAADATVTLGLLSNNSLVSNYINTTVPVSGGTLLYTLPSNTTAGSGYQIAVGVLNDAKTQYLVSGTSAIFTVTSQTNQDPLDITPRIAYWAGKINQHVDVNGQWVTDSDGASASTIDKLTYCKKWYPTTVSVADYKTETISTWKDAGNVGGPYTSSVLTTKCIGSNPTQSITLTSPYAGQTFQIGGTMQVNWTSSNVPLANAVWIKLHNEGSSAIFAPISLGANDGSETVTLPTSASGNFAALIPGFYDVTIGTLGLDGTNDITNTISATITLVSANNNNNNNNTSYFPDGCSSLQGYSQTTGLRCDGSNSNSNQNSQQFLPGCTSYQGYSMTTGLLCSGVSNTTSYPTTSGNVNYYGTTIPSSWTHVVGFGNSSTNTTSQDCTALVFTKTLRLGQSGDQVQSLQEILNNQGYLADGSVTGSFDVPTRYALKAFQRANGVLVTGYTGSTSRAKLNAIATQQCLGQ